jgi:O-antigen/teichoic acid export membrane protein
MNTSSTTGKRFVKGVFASGFGQIITLAAQIVGIPLFFKFWGTEVYGEWVLLSTLPNYLQISDLSFGTAAGNAMTVLVAAGRRDEAKKIYQSAWLLIVLVSLLIAVVSISLVWVLPIHKILLVPTLGHRVAALTVTFLILQIIVAQQGGVFGAAYRCDGLYATGSMANNLLRLAEFSATIAVLVLRGNLVTLAETVLIVRSIGYCAIFLHVSRKVPWLKLGTEHADWEALKPTIGPALAFNAFPLGQMMNLQGTLYVIGYLFSPVAVAVFSTARTLSRVVLQISVAFANTMWVELSTAFGADDIPLARKLHRRLCQMGVWFCVIGSSVLAFVGPWIYSVWTRNKAPLNVPMFEVLLAVVAVNSLWNCSYVVPMSVNRHQRIALEYLVVMTVGVAVTLGLGQNMGLLGIAISLLVSEVAMNVVTLKTSLPMVADTFLPFIRIVSQPPLVWMYSRARSLL